MGGFADTSLSNQYLYVYKKAQKTCLPHFSALYSKQFTAKFECLRLVSKNAVFHDNENFRFSKSDNFGTAKHHGTGPSDLVFPPIFVPRAFSYKLLGSYKVTAQLRFRNFSGPATLP